MFANGSDVKVSSHRGSVVMKASINGRGRPPQGIVFVPFLFDRLQSQRKIIEHT
jgi:formylmethanofuran dehydrogenase subunit D